MTNTEHNSGTAPTNDNVDAFIAPAAVVLNVNPALGQPPASNKWQQNRWIIVGATLCGLLLVGVLFVLPQLVEQQSQRPAVAAGTTETAPPATEPRGPSESPWADAQFALERRETQTLLAKMLEKQKRLETMAVTTWAPAAYDQAQQHASSADLLYRQQDFAAAQSLYQTTLDEFDALLLQSRTVRDAALQAGEQALQAGEQSNALTQFQLTMAIDPTHAQAQKGLARANQLDAVVAQVKQARQQQRAGDLDQAAASLQQALSLDPAFQPAQTALADIKLAISERDFAKHMSLGFAAVSNNQFEQAISEFRRAEKIKPGAPDVASALNQALNQKTQLGIQELLAQAEALEAEESWSAALAAYDNALALDSNLVAARVGKIRAGSRADIDSKLTEILANPDRLATAQVHADYAQFLVETQKLQNKGEKLAGQLSELAAALQVATQPVAVQFRSDNATKVMLYPVGELGNFLQVERSLAPGKYTLVGTRNGFRDVRQEFTVSGGKAISEIIIQCTEKIPKG